MYYDIFIIPMLFSLVERICEANPNTLPLHHMGRAMQKRVFEHMQTAKSKIILSVRAV